MFNTFVGALITKGSSRNHNSDAEDNVDSTMNLAEFEKLAAVVHAL